MSAGRFKKLGIAATDRQTNNCDPVISAARLAASGRVQKVSIVLEMFVLHSVYLRMGRGGEGLAKRRLDIRQRTIEVM